MELADVGTGAIVIALVAAGIAVALAMVDRASAVTVLHVATAATTLAVGLLVFALLTGAFELVYVAETTTRRTPAPYRLAALWGGMEGSLLFWAWFHLALGSAAAAVQQRRRRVGSPTVAGVVAAIAGIELALGLLLSPPFARLDIPAIDGGGLVAVLRHPAMIVHPPLLYLGLTATIVPFALLAGAARSGPGPIAPVRAWLRLSWLALTLGMIIGAAWAYVEVGWGGFWAWDAVENTSLLPWLAVTGALHAAGDVRRRRRSAVAFVGFTLVAFASTTLGIVLTRSGTTGSVHSFAEAVDTGRGLLVLTVGVLIGGSVVARRLLRPTAVGSPAGPIATDPITTDPITTAPTGGRDRPSVLDVNSVILAGVWVVVAAGTFVPAVDRILGGPASAIEAGFYHRLAGPMAAVGLMAIGLTAIGRSVGIGPGRRSGLGAAIAIPVVGATLALLFGTHPVGGAVMVAALFTLLTLGGASLGGANRGGASVGRSDPAHRFSPPLVLVHAGLAVLLAGSAGSGLGEQLTSVLAVGETATVDGRTFRLDRIGTGETDEYLFVRVELSEQPDAERPMEANAGPTDDPIVVELRRYHGQIRPSSESALQISARADTIISLSDVDPGGTRARVTFSVRPLVLWVWIGGVAMLIGVGWHGFAASGRTGRDQDDPGRGRDDEARYRAARE